MDPAMVDAIMRFSRHALAGLDGPRPLTAHAAATIAAALQADHVVLQAIGGEEASHGTPAGGHAVDVRVGDPDHPLGILTVERAGEPLSRKELAFVHAITDRLALATARDRAEQRRREEAARDRLTGLLGRERFVERLDAVIAGGGTLLLLDVDDFGSLNETLGPEGGDAVLSGIAHRLAAALPRGALVGRVGADELAVFDPRLDAEIWAVEAARELQAVLHAPFGVHGGMHHATLGIGILVCTPGAYTDGHAAICHAHVAQRRARGLGRGRHAVYGTGEREALARRRRIEQDLRRGLDAREFRLVYQPIVDLASGRITGAEALVRWEHPEHGTIGPGGFIDVAEASDLIVPLGRWVLREAVGQLKAWQETSRAFEDFRLSVNLSGRQFADPDFVGSVRRLLEEHGVDPRGLVFELTETALVDESEQVVAAVEGLRALGVELALDDFGTGYASISYVRRFAFGTLKLDRSFISGLGEKADDTALITAAISMGAALGMRIVAEGVEEPAQAALLRELGCTSAQGYLFSRPVSAPAIRALLHRGAGAGAALAPVPAVA